MTSWLPVDVQAAYETMHRWSAWWVGDAAELAAAFHDPTQSSPKARAFFSDQTPRATRFSFWGNPTPLGEASDKVHIPVASEIATKSADLLFSNPPRITFTSAANQQFIDSLIDDGLITTLHEGAETCSALGGIYLKVCWDPTVSDKPFIGLAQPDRAIHVFTWGKLQSVTFWTIIHQDEDNCVRWMETHEPGAIRHAVFAGDEDEIGTQVPLADYPQTADLVTDDPYEAVIETGTDLLTAEYIPNMRPNKIWRQNQNLKDLGQSDYADIETTMDRLDQQWTEWVKEIRLGKTRIFIDKTELNSQGPGQPAFFDLDRDLYVPIGMGADGDVKEPLKSVQPDLRVEKFQLTTQSLWNEVITGAGYSVATFGAKSDATIITATEVKARERQTITTRNRKATYWSAGLKRILEALTAVAAAQFGLGVTQENPDVVFPAYVVPEPEETSNGVSVAVGAGVMSKRTAVKELHQSWDDNQVQAELDELETEAEAAQPPVPAPGPVAPTGGLGLTPEERQTLDEVTGA